MSRGKYKFYFIILAGWNPCLRGHCGYRNGLFCLEWQLSNFSVHPGVPGSLSRGRVWNPTLQIQSQWNPSMSPMLQVMFFKNNVACTLKKCCIVNCHPTEILQKKGLSSFLTSVGRVSWSAPSCKSGRRTCSALPVLNKVTGKHRLILNTAEIYQCGVCDPTSPQKLQGAPCLLGH